MFEYFLRMLYRNRCVVVRKRGPRVAYECGHTDHEEYDFVLYGDIFPWGRETYDRRDICGECWLKKLTPGVIRCVRCGRGIAPGNQIALYVDHPAHNRNWKTVVEVDGGMHTRVLGCVRRACEPGGHLAGQWTGKGVQFFFHGRTIVEEVFHTKRPVFISGRGK